MFGIKPKSDLNPDLLVAQGAAICAELYSKGKPIQSLMCDVTPLTLGIEVIGDNLPNHSGEYKYYVSERNYLLQCMIIKRV